MAEHYNKSKYISFSITQFLALLLFPLISFLNFTQSIQILTTESASRPIESLSLHVGLCVVQHTELSVCESAPPPYTSVQGV